MWFRIELHKDGSVASCAEVEGSFKDSKHVLFVEADNKQTAIRDAARRYRERFRKATNERYHRQRAKGLCMCGAPLTGKTKCEKCLAEQNEGSRRRREAIRNGTYVPPKAMADELFLKKRRDATVRYQKKWSERAREIYWADDLNIPTLKKVLAQYDKLSPRAFRSWLEEASGVPTEERVGVAAE